MSVLHCESIVRAALGEPVKREGRELVYRCPHPETHKNGDAHPSLKINAQKNVWACFPCNASGTAWQLAAFLAGLDPNDKAGVAAWLRDHGLLNGKRPKAPHLKRKPVAVYEYRDAHRNPVARKLRFEPKAFAWQRFENGAWVDGLAGIKTPLYRWPEIEHERLVLLTEGEKDADFGARIGLPTTTSGGTDSFREDHAETLRGKHTCVIVDADPPGRAEAQKRAAMLHGKAASVKVCEIPASKDLAEAIGKGVPKSVLLALFEDTPEWKPCEGREILDSVFRFLRRFVALTENQARVVSLWAAHTHAMDAADCTPYLSVNSPEKASGKTRTLEILELLVLEPWFTGRVTAAVLVRKIDAKEPTLLLDESDAAFSGEETYAEALRGVLNTGYRRSGAASLCVGQGANLNYQEFSTYCAKALAGIGKLPDTVADRSVPIRLKRARRGEVARFRKREVEGEAADIKARLAAWCIASVEKLRDAQPAIPEAVSDRQADCCEPLLAIADLAGGEWPEAARRAFVALCGESQADDQSVGVRLLADIQEIFGERGMDRIWSEDLAVALANVETSPWAEWSKGKPLTKEKLARLLKPFAIWPDSVRIGDYTKKGYLLSDFADAFSRYLPTEKRNSGTTRINTGEDMDSQSGAGSVCSASEITQNPNKNGASSGVPAPNGNGVPESLLCPRCGNQEQNIAAARYHYNKLCPMLGRVSH